MVDKDDGKGENVACAVKTEVVADCSGLNGAWSLREEGAEGGRRWTKRGSGGICEGRRRSPVVWAVRGRGSRRYEPINKNNGPASQTHNRQSEKSLEKNAQVSFGRTMTPGPSMESDPVPLRKQMFASNLNSASPPFYPSGSSIKEGNLAPKRDLQAGSTSRNVRPGVMDEGFSVQQNSALPRGKNVADPIGMDKLYINEPINSAAGKSFNNMHIPPSGVNSSQSSQPRAPGRGVSIPVSMNYQPVPSHNQITEVSPSPTHQAIHRSSTAGRTQSSQQASTPPLNQRSVSGSQVQKVQLSVRYMCKS
ncbi:hypothetical protein K1719_042368 [Acacia pycnantha]|nr:hypothetical protein K1719_042368 [Acacia pycnantha]